MAYERIGINTKDGAKLQDNASLKLGDGANAYDPALYDVKLTWDGTDLDMLPASNNAVFKIGNGTVSMDLWLYGSAAANYLWRDASANLLAVKGTAGLVTIGDFVSATLGGIKVSASQTKALDVCADDGGASIVTGNHVRATRSRLLITTATGNDVTAEGTQNQLKIATTTPTTTSFLAGCYDYLEVGAAATIACYSAALRAEVDCGSNAVTVAASSAMVGVMADCVFNGTITETGVCAGVWIGSSKAGSTNTWPSAIYVANAGQVFKFPSGTSYEAGVKVATVTTADSAGNTITGSGVLKMMVGSTAYYIPFYAAGQVTGE